MSRCRGSYVVVVIGLAVGSVLAVVWRAHHPAHHAPRPKDASAPQCGHWCVLRCCELLGAPVDMKTVLELLPPRSGGHSLLEIADTLKEVGFDVEGRRGRLEAAAKGDLPCIVHLRDPDHFVVLLATEENRFDVFDNAGQRRTLSAETLSKRWTGNSLHVRRRAHSGPLPAFVNRLATRGPCIQFQRLYLDIGRVKPAHEVTAFAFPFQNLGNTPLVVEAVKTSCACTRSTKPEVPIPPGGKGTIELQFRAEATGAGFLSQNALVKTNDPHFPVIRLRVGGSPNQGAYVIPRDADLGEIAIGESKSVLLFVRSNPQAPDVTVAHVASLRQIATVERSKPTEGLLRKNWPQWRRADCPAPECKSSLTCILRVTVSSGDHDVGPFDDVISIFTGGGDDKPMTVPIRGRFVPPVSLCPAVLGFGQVEADAEYHQCVTIAPKSTTRYRIRGVQAENAGMTWSFSRSLSDAGSQIGLTATGRTLAAASGLSATVRVWVENCDREFLLPLSVCGWMEPAERDESPRVE